MVRILSMDKQILFLVAVPFLDNVFLKDVLAFHYYLNPRNLECPECGAFSLGILTKRDGKIGWFGLRFWRLRMLCSWL